MSKTLGQVPLGLGLNWMSVVKDEPTELSCTCTLCISLCSFTYVVHIKAPWCLRSSVEVAGPPSAALH